MTKEKPVARVLVLEDCDYRVEWLQSVLQRSRAEIVWHTTVEPFLEAAKTDHDLAIFDHDLDFEHYRGDYYKPLPKNGAQAAEAYDPVRKVPCLIWSQNPVGAKRIEQILTKKGIPTTRVAYETRNLEKMATALRRMFE
jgi:hypothetical protein